jgi:hypothetical protein
MTTETNGPEPIGPTEHLETAAYWKGLYFDAVEESRVLLAERDELRTLRAQRQAALDLCDAADEAELKPAITDFEPIEVPWTLAVRKILEGGSP